VRMSQEEKVDGRGLTEEVGEEGGGGEETTKRNGQHI
jgi:hypothetical protein